MNAAKLEYVTNIMEPVFNPNMHLDPILIMMTEKNCADIFFQTDESVWLNTPAGKVRTIERQLNSSEVEAILAHITKSPASIGILQKRPIDCRYEIKKVDFVNGRPVEKKFGYRVNAVGLNEGINIVIRKIDSSPPTIHQMGIDQELVDVVLNSKQGLVVISGATSNGKTTTLAALIREAITQVDCDHHLVTVESPIEFVYKGLERDSSIVSQIPIGIKVETFDKGVINSLRMAPTIIKVGETRDSETAKACLEASNTGHLVLTSLHANTVHGSVERIVGLFETDAEKHKARVDCINELKLIIAQRLCKTVDNKKTAIRSYLVFNKEVRDYIAQDYSDITRRTEEAVKLWGKPMKVSIQEKLDAGIISKAEATKLFAEYE